MTLLTLLTLSEKLTLLWALIYNNLYEKGQKGHEKTRSSRYEHGTKNRIDHNQPNVADTF